MTNVLDGLKVIDTGNAAGLANARSSLQELTEAGRDQALQFENVCQPA